jgi:hypothetical protein
MRIFERIIRDDLIKRYDHLIDSRQHGFKLEKYCTTQLVSFCVSLALSLHENIRTDVVKPQMPLVAALLHSLLYLGPMLLHWLIYQSVCVLVSLGLELF